MKTNVETVVSLRQDWKVGNGADENNGKRIVPSRNLQLLSHHSHHHHRIRRNQHLLHLRERHQHRHLWYRGRRHHHHHHHKWRNRKRRHKLRNPKALSTLPAQPRSSAHCTKRKDNGKQLPIAGHFTPTRGNTPADILDDSALVGLNLIETPATEAPAANASVCFPADSTVITKTGSTKRMGQVIVGERDAVGDGTYSDVFMCTHKLWDVIYESLDVKT